MSGISYYQSLETRRRTPFTTRYRLARRLEIAIVRVLHMVSRSWNWDTMKHRKSWSQDRGMMVGHPAFCDGLMIGDAPWLCYCCVRLRLRLEGRPYRDSYKPWAVGVPLRAKYFIIRTARRGSWAWPSVKWVYPANERDTYRIWARVLEETT